MKHVHLADDASFDGAAVCGAVGRTERRAALKEVGRITCAECVAGVHGRQSVPARELRNGGYRVGELQIGHLGRFFGISHVALIRGGAVVTTAAGRLELPGHKLVWRRR